MNSISLSLLDLWTLIQVIGKCLASKLCCRIHSDVLYLFFSGSHYRIKDGARAEVKRRTLAEKQSLLLAKCKSSLTIFFSIVWNFSLYSFAFPSVWGAASCPNLHWTTSLLNFLQFLPSNPPVRSAGQYSFWLSSLWLLFFFELCLPQVRTRKRMGSARPRKNLLVWLRA